VNASIAPVGELSLEKHRKGVIANAFDCLE
jgi:hypothetical protein